MSQLQLTLDSELGNVCLASLATHRICLHAGMTEVQASMVELCVAEALTNVIQHAYSGEPGHELTLTLAIAGDRIQMEITDSGVPMPATCIQRLLHGAPEEDFDPADLDSLLEEGRGLQIIHEVMDQVSYAREGSQNRLQLMKTLGVR